MFIFVACRKTYNRVLSRQELHKGLAASKDHFDALYSLGFMGIGF
jgi:hypothetical protein